MDLGPHAEFIIWSYAAVAFVITALIIWVSMDEAHQRRTLKDLEDQGITRRSAANETNRTTSA